MASFKRGEPPSWKYYPAEVRERFMKRRDEELEAKEVLRGRMNFEAFASIHRDGVEDFLGKKFALLHAMLGGLTNEDGEFDPEKAARVENQKLIANAWKAFDQIEKAAGFHNQVKRVDHTHTLQQQIARELESRSHDEDGLIDVEVVDD